MSAAHSSPYSVGSFVLTPRTNRLLDGGSNVADAINNALIPMPNFGTPGPATTPAQPLPPAPAPVAPIAPVPTFAPYLGALYTLPGAGAYRRNAYIPDDPLFEVHPMFVYNNQARQRIGEEGMMDLCLKVS